MLNYKEWYEKNKEKHRLCARNYYHKHKDRQRQLHKAWAQRNVDTGGSIWRKYGRWSRIRNPNIDKEYYARHREEILKKKHEKYQKERNYYKL